MPKIIINEEDLTNPIITSDTTDIAYIPGFADTNPGDNTYTLGEPQLVTELDDFVARFGSKPYYFGKSGSVDLWSSGTEYDQYTVVLYNNVYYASVGSDNDNEPNNGITAWKALDTAPAAYSDEITYNRYDVVESGTPNSYFVSKVDGNTAHSPVGDDEDNYWTLVASTGYSSGNYAKYAVVVDGEYYFVSTISDNTTGGTSSSPVTTVPVWKTNTIDEWDDDGSYDKYTMVSYEGAIFVSLHDNNKGRNPVTSSDWATNGNTGSDGKYEEYGIDVDCDIAYVYATELLRLGLPIYYEVVGASGYKCATVKTFYSQLPTIFTKLEEKGGYYIKYITSGGYPVVKDTTTNEIIHAMLDCAATRGDAIALIDHKEGMPVNREISGSAWNTVNNMAEGTYDKVINDNIVDIGSYGAMLTPWEEHTFVRPYTVNDENVYTFTLPASFDYLTCLATSIKNNPSWVAVAGVQRASLPYDNKRIKQLPKITNSVADSYMTYGKGETPNGRSINAITDIRNYGLTIWGNRTLLNNDNTRDIGAFGYLNIRNLACDVKKVVYAAAQRFMFEQNNDILWLNFTSAITPLLDKMATGGGISGYKIIKEKCNKKAKLKATVVLYPIYAVEEFEVTIQMRNEDVVVE